MSDLRNVLEVNRGAFGSNFENLGKNGLYLSYDSASGWSSVHLNFIQRLIRQFCSCFGIYQSTHLQTITRALTLETEDLDLVSPILKNKVMSSWRRAYPNQRCPLGSGSSNTRSSNSFRRSNTSISLPSGPLHLQDSYTISSGGTSIHLQKGSLLLAPVEAIVNAANEACLGGGGIDGIIHREAGSSLVTHCRNHLPQVRPGVRCETGSAVITPSFGLGTISSRHNSFSHIIHTVGPRGSSANRENLLYNAYISSLEVAERNGLKKVAFPGISIGIFGFPARLAGEIQMRAAVDFTTKPGGTTLTDIHFRYLTNALYDETFRGANNVVSIDP